MFRFRMMDAIIVTGGAVFVSFLIAAALSMPVWVSSVLLITVPIILIAGSLALLSAPYLLLAASRFVQLRAGPLREWWVKRSPHVEVPAKHWRSLFFFRRIEYTSNNVNLNIPNFRGSVRPEVLTWCRDTLGYAPTISPRHILPEDERIRIFVRFRRPEDAFAFKMRWL